MRVHGCEYVYLPTHMGKKKISTLRSKELTFRPEAAVFKEYACKVSP